MKRRDFLRGLVVVPAAVALAPLAFRPQPKPKGLTLADIREARKSLLRAGVPGPYVAYIHRATAETMFRDVTIRNVYKRGYGDTLGTIYGIEFKIAPGFADMRTSDRD